MSKPNILCIDDEAPLRKLLKSELEKCGYDVDTVADYEAARLQLTGAVEYSTVIVDFYIDSESKAMRFITDIQHSHPQTRIIALCSETHVSGIHASLRKPFSLNELIKILTATEPVEGDL